MLECSRPIHSKEGVADSLVLFPAKRQGFLERVRKEEPTGRVAALRYLSLFPFYERAKQRLAIKSPENGLLGQAKYTLRAIGVI